MSAPELSRPVALDTIGVVPRPLRIEADGAELAALAKRFGLPAIATLDASLTIARDGQAVIVAGRVHGRATQTCVATGEAISTVVEEPLSLRFVPAGAAAGEIELDAAALDVIEHDGRAIDVGEAVAESFALALDPFPRAPDADEKLRAAGVLREGEEQRGALAGLAALLGSKD